MSDKVGGKVSRKDAAQQKLVDKLAESFGRSDLTGETQYHDGPSFASDSFSRITNLPVIPFVHRGASKAVEHFHIWKLPVSLSAAKCWEEFSPIWEEEKKQPNPSVLKAVMKAFGSQFLFCLLCVFVYSASQYALPLLMPYIVNWFIYNSILPTWWVYVYVVAIWAASQCGSLFNYHAQLICYKFGLRVRAAVTTLIFRKSLYTTLNRNQTSGTIVNLMSQDAQLMLETLPLFMQGMLAPIQIAVTLGLMSQYLGPYTLISFAVVILSGPITGGLASRFGSLRAKIQQRSDNRLKYVKEFLTAIRIVKYYAWEVPFVRNIGATRDAQLEAVSKLLWVRAWLISVLTNIPSLGIGFTFFFWGIGHSMAFTSIFSAMTYLQMLRMPFIFLPMLIAFLGQYFASFGRITFFALRSEIAPRFHDDDPDGRGGMNITNGTFAWETKLSIAESHFIDVEKEATDIQKEIDLEDEDMDKKAKLTVKLKEKEAEKAWVAKIVRNLQLTQQRATQLAVEGTTTIQDSNFEVITEEEKQKYTPLREPLNNLHNITLEVPQGKLTAVVGSVGSGKSTLANAFLGEVSTVDGEVWVSAEVSFAPQEAWILNATIRDNITFGKPYDPKWYAQVIRACALTTDLAMFPASDLTEIGERGTNLSGGQRQRINVARAMYSNSKIVILDDPFSAVDAHVGEHMFAHVAKAMAQAGRCVLLVTNQLHFVPEADNVAVLKKGKLIESGSPQDLMKREGGMLKKMLAKQSAAANSNVSVSDAERKEADAARAKMKAAKDVEFEPTPEKDEEYRRKGALIKAEERESGNIGIETYWNYIKSGGIVLLITVLIAQGIRTAARVMGGVWLSWWSDPYNSHGFSKWAYEGGYIAFTIGEGLFTMVGSFLFIYFAIGAGRTLHNGMTAAVSRAPTGWFDVTPVGRIITRFSKDIDFIDVQLPQLVEQSYNFFYVLTGVVASIAVGTPWVLLLLLVAAIGFTALTYHYRKTSIQVQRLEALSRAPIFSHFNESLEGAATIRAYGMANLFKVANMNKIDNNTVDFVGLRYCSAWFGMTLDFFGNIFVFMSFIVMILVRVYAPNSIGVGYMIFAVSNTGSISSSLAAFSNAITDLENKMNSAERVLGYFNLPEEAPTHIPDAAPPASWPEQGAITIKDLVIEYKEGVPVLKDLSCKIKPREKVGIVGRTGAGKSTLITALFRTVEPVKGSIHIDNVDITKIGLFDLRSRLSIIPQMPQLFVGTVRYNLDPFDEHTDDELWKVLKMVKLKDGISQLDGKLLAPVEENGSNFSVGQRQLLSMARCLLRNTHVLLLDEATAAVDVETDALLQSMIRRNFKDKTVLTIAHRLNTIMDSDRIMVLDAGQIVEFDTPANLLNKKDGVLHGMVEATGSDSAAYLRSIALGQVSVAESLVALSKSGELQRSAELMRSGELMNSREIQRSIEMAKTKGDEMSSSSSEENPTVEHPPRPKDTGTKKSTAKATPAAKKAAPAESSSEEEESEEEESEEESEEEEESETSSSN